MYIKFQCVFNLKVNDYEKQQIISHPEYDVTAVLQFTEVAINLAYYKFCCDDKI
jgi:hypothetical protein